MMRDVAGVRRLGPVLLSAVLLSVPRALGGRTFGEPVRHVQVAPADPDATAFGEALAAAVRRYASRLAGGWHETARVVRIHGLAHRAGGSRECVSVTVGEGPRPRRLLLDYAPEHRVAAALVLLGPLAEAGPESG